MNQQSGIRVVVYCTLKGLIESTFHREKTTIFSEFTDKGSPQIVVGLFSGI